MVDQTLRLKISLSSEIEISATGGVVDQSSVVDEDVYAAGEEVADWGDAGCDGVCG
jgi:hypothetical protein